LVVIKSQFFTLFTPRLRERDDLTRHKKEKHINLANNNRRTTSINDEKKRRRDIVSIKKSSTIWQQTHSTHDRLLSRRKKWRDYIQHRRWYSHR